MNDGRLLTGGKDQTIRVWDFASGRELRRLIGHTGAIGHIAHTADGRLIASASVDYTLRVWDLPTGQELYSGQTDEYARGLDVSTDGRHLVCTTRRRLTIRDMTRPARYREFARTVPAARQALQANPNDPASLKVLGEYYAFSGVWEWGSEFLEKARAGGADVSSLELARCHWLSGNSDAARREFRAAIERREAPRAYLEMCLAAVASATTRPATAPSDDAVDGDRWLWQHTINPKAWERDPQNVLALCKQRVEDKPQDSPAWQLLGWALYRAGDYPACVNALEKSISLQDQPKGGDPWQWFFLAMAHAKLGDRDLAVAWYSTSVQWLAENPTQDNADAKMMRIEAAELLGLPDRWPWRPQDADRRVYQRLLELSKDAEWPKRQLDWVNQSTTRPATRPAAGLRPAPSH